MEVLAGCLGVPLHVCHVPGQDKTGRGSVPRCGLECKQESGGFTIEDGLRNLQ